MSDKPIILVCRGSGIELETIVLGSSKSQQLCRLVWFCNPRVARKISAERNGAISYVPTLPILPGKPLRRLSVHPTFEEWYKQSQAYDFEYSRIAESPLPDFHYERALAELAVAVRAISLVRPDLVLIKGGTRNEAACMKTVAEHLGVPVIYSERGPFPQAATMAEEMIGPEIFRSPGALASVEDLAVDQYIAEFLKSNLSAWHQPEIQGSENLRKELGISDPEKIIFYAGQVETDANMVLHSPKFKTNAGFLEFISENVSHLENAVLVVKPHPKEIVDFSAISSPKCRTIISRNINIKEILPISSVVVTINSTVGFETLFYGRPVISGGNAFYSHRGFTFDIDAENTDSLKQFLQNPVLTENQQTDFQNFARNYIRRYVYFANAESGLNGSDEYVTRLIAACKKQAYDIPLDLVLHAEEILASAQTPIKIPPKKSPLHRWTRKIFPKHKQKPEAESNLESEPELDASDAPI